MPYYLLIGRTWLVSAAIVGGGVLVAVGAHRPIFLSLSGACDIESGS